MFVKGTLKQITMVVAAALFMLMTVGCSTGDQSKKTASHNEEQAQKIARLDQLADEMYAKVMKGDILGSRESISKMGDQVAQIQFQGVTTLEGVNALTNTIEEAKRVFNAVKFSVDEGQISAAKLRLAADALKSKSDPMWHQYYKLLQTSLEQLELSVQKQDKPVAYQASELLELHYQIIHPSLLISQSATDVEKMDSLVIFFKSQLSSDQPAYPDILKALPEARATVDKLFGKKEKPAYLPLVDDEKPFIWSIAMGSAILAALTYAGWRLSKKERTVIVVGRRDQE
jgi:sporulation protein YpjB